MRCRVSDLKVGDTFAFTGNDSFTVVSASDAHIVVDGHDVTGVSVRGRRLPRTSRMVECSGNNVVVAEAAPEPVVETPVVEAAPEPVAPVTEAVVEPETAPEADKTPEAGKKDSSPKAKKSDSK